MRVGESVGKLAASQRERLWHIDFLARFRGQLTRHDLAERFQIALSNATRDFKVYRELAPNNLDYDHSSRTYRRAQTFKPLFSYNREHTLQTLTLGLGEGLGECEQAIYVDAAFNLNQPNLDVLAEVSRAIYSQSALSIGYVSIGSGESHREIVPHSLVNTGERWHVRAFCRNSQAFRDFVLTRITSIDQAKTQSQKEESIDRDSAWGEQHELELQPHPKATHQRAIELDYGLSAGEVIKVTVRAATAGYLLRRWQVDCSLDASLPPNEYQLALKQPKLVSQHIDLSIAPGVNKKANR